MFAPGYLWLSFKTMPETPALFLANLSVLALLKATLALSFLSFGLTLLLFYLGAGRGES